MKLFLTLLLAPAGFIAILFWLGLCLRYDLGATIYLLGELLLIALMVWALIGMWDTE